MVERSGAGSPSASIGRSSPGPGRSASTARFSGAPPGGRSLESFSSKNFSSFKAPSKFETVRPINIQKVPNKISTHNKEIKFNPQSRQDTFKPLSPELKSAIRNTSSPEKSLTKPKVEPLRQKGSERFKALGVTREYKIGRHIDSLDKQIAQSEIAKMTKVIEAPKVQTAKAEVLKPPTTKSENLLKLPKFEINPTKVTNESPVRSDKLIKLIKESRTIQEKSTEKTPTINKLPEKGSLRFEKSSELLKRLNALKKPELFIKPMTKSETGGTQTKKSEIFAYTLKPQKVSLAEITKIEQKAKELTLPKPKTESQIQMIKDIRGLTKELRKASETQNAKVELAKDLPTIKILAEQNLPRKTEWIKNVLQNQKVPLKELTEIKTALNEKRTLPENQKSTPQITEDKSLTTQVKNIETVQKILTELKPQSKYQSKPEISTKLAEAVVTQSTTIDVHKAKELIIKNQENKTAIEVPSLKSAQEIQAFSQKLDAEKTEQKILTPEKQAEIKVFTESLKNPEIISKITPEKREEAIALIKTLTETTTYQSNPELQTKTTELVKELERQVVEEQQIAKTVIEMKHAGMAETQIVEIMTATVESKQLSLTPQHIEQILQKAEEHLTNLASIENPEELEVNEYERVLEEIKTLYIELDDKALAKRFETLYKAIQEAYEKALDEGRDHFTGAEIIDAHPKYEKEEEKSEMILGQKRNDGGHMDALAEINSSQKFHSLEHAYEHVAAILLKNRPGRIREVLKTSPLTEAEIRKIPQDKPLPVANINSSTHIFPPFSSQILTSA